MEEAINAQINAEFWSAYLYLSMSCDFARKGLKGMANWFSIQFREEQDHARMLMDHVLARGGKVALAPIAEVPSAWDSPLAAFEDTLKHEKSVTARIDALCELAAAEKDFASANRLVWFVDEQIEEEENVQGIIDALKLVGDDKVGTFMLNWPAGSMRALSPDNPTDRFRYEDMPPGRRAAYFFAGTVRVRFYPEG